MKTPHELKKQVRDLIAANKTGKALELLAKNQLSALDRDLIILNGRFNKIKDDQRLGIIDNEKVAQELNKINIGLLDLSEKIGVIAEKTPIRNLSPESENKTNKKILLMAVGVLLVAIIGFFGIRALSPSPPDDTYSDVIIDTPDTRSVQADFKMDKTNCTAPCEVQFTNNSQNADEFLWKFGDGQISNLPNPLHKYIEGKTYEVTLTASSESGRDKETKTIQINALPPPQPEEVPLPIANFKMNKTTCTAPCMISFTNLSKNATKYSWMVDNKQESENRDLKHTFGSPGKYNIKLIASNGSEENTYEQFIRIDAPQALTLPNPFIDSRDGQSYSWKKMKDGKKWMIQNLNYKISDSWCYNDTESNCIKYGRLYAWETAKKACPSGWHLPNNDEWEALLIAYGGGYFDFRSNKNVGDPKASYKALTNGGDSSFSALFGGRRYSGDGLFYDLGDYGHYWGSADQRSDQAWQYYFYKLPGNLGRNLDSKSWGFSCRCIQDD